MLPISARSSEAARLPGSEEVAESDKSRPAVMLKLTLMTERPAS
jgi:hypothetical protein